MKKIIDGIILAAENSSNARIKDTVIGLGFTMVFLDNESCGLAYTLKDNIKAGCEVFKEAGKITGRELREVITWIGGSSPIASAIGLAAVNAVLKPPENCLGVDLLDSLGLKQGEKVVTVGRFKPMESRLERLGVRLNVIEWSDSPEPLSSCDVALITATSVINNTIDELLERTGDAREVVVLGPSTPYAPEAFYGTSVTKIAGSIISDPVRTRKIVSEGGGTKTLGKSLSRWLAAV